MIEQTVSSSPTNPAKILRRGVGFGWWRRCRQAATDLLYPPQCQFCSEDLIEHETAVVLCPACHVALAPSLEATCVRCDLPVPSGNSGQPDCQRCRTTKFHFTLAVALGVYQNELADAVRRTKQPLHEPLALALGAMLANRVSTRWPDFHADLLIPIPMYWGRRWLRGHNGPELMAEAAAQNLSFPLATDALFCHRHHKRQATLSRAERFTNIRGVFSASRSYTLAGTKILLVDDTMTTGATASEAARMLIQAGAAEIRVAVVARGIGFD